jgi:hypothetical protein
MMEIRAKLTEFGWDVRIWPLESSLLSNDSPGHSLFFALFILPATFAACLAFARHGDQDEIE